MHVEARERSAGYARAHKSAKIGREGAAQIEESCTWGLQGWKDRAGVKRVRGEVEACEAEDANAGVLLRH